MSTVDTVKTQIQKLIDNANAKTGRSDSDLTTAHEALLGGYGVGGEPTLQDKTITENGTYTHDRGYDGLGEVTVNVSGGTSEELPSAEGVGF